MAFRTTRHIPNMITCCNLVSGCIATVMAFQQDYYGALGFILLGAFFDFFDGMAARLLGVSSPMGIEMDSLADDVTFGVAPSVILYSLLREVSYPVWLLPVQGWFPFLAFIMAAFSALRLGKFNIDKRQSVSFLGLPTPANALFWSGLAVSAHAFLVSVYGMALWLTLGMLLMSVLLVTEIPMFSLKFKDGSWQHNWVRYLFLLVCLAFIIVWKVGALPLIIVWYIVLSLLTQRKAE